MTQVFSQIVQGAASESGDTLTLTYEARLLRRKRLSTDSGRSVLVDLPETASLNHGDALRAEDGTTVGIRAAAEPLVAVRGRALARLAWHIGNRHTPCQIEQDHLLIRRDAVLERMLEGLGAVLEPLEAPFTPEGGAYGHGRTMGHAH